MASEPVPSIIPLARAGAGAGGKAAGLARLIALGLRVPPGFVITGARPGRLPEGLKAAFLQLGGPVAVRSSAADEDGRDASFAGQYATVLDVADEESLVQAVERCLTSLNDSRAAAYRAGMAGGGDGHAMSVVVQRMVSPRAAGVLFTADPVGERDRLVVDAVAGTAEDLVSGYAEPDHFELDRQGAVRRTRLASRRGPLLGDTELRRLTREALAAEAQTGLPLDLEWAIDERGALHWLQARPITALGSDAQELDTQVRDDAWLTWANIGEMLPGAVCPLDLSTVVRGIDHGIQQMNVACGAQPRPEPELQVVAVSRGHLFFNLSAMLPFCSRVGGSSPSQLTYAISGRTLPGFAEGFRPAPLHVRARNGLRYLRYILAGAAEVHRLRRELRGFAVATGASAAETHRAIDAALPVLMDAYKVHIQSSAGSGLTAGVLQGVIAGGRIPTAEEEAALAELLAGARGVESAELAAILDRLAAQLAGTSPGFHALPPGEALAWLRSPAAGAAGADFAAFLESHGHRCLRELSLQQPGWADDPRPLVRALQAAARAGAGDTRPAGETPRGPRGTSMPVRALLTWSKRTVRRREQSKSLLVWVTNQLKQAYRVLGQQLVAEDLLPDEDALFFLSHEELGELVQRRDPALARRATARRRTFQSQRTLRFPTVAVGPPRPIDDEPDDSADDELEGQPVSPGVVEGVARVVLDVEQAAALQPGEILVAPVTDVGWSPYFRIIGGLATDVGSAISHGAVVAREYGLPAVVNLRVASRQIRSGERVRLDANRGTLRRLPGAGS